MMGRRLAASFVEVRLLAVEAARRAGDARNW